MSIGRNSCNYCSFGTLVASAIWNHSGNAVNNRICCFWALFKGKTLNIFRMGDSKADETDAQGENIELDYDQVTSKGEITVKVICLGDSAVGKSK